MVIITYSGIQIVSMVQFEPLQTPKLIMETIKQFMVKY
jgi:hypothetical protein